MEFSFFWEEFRNFMSAVVFEKGKFADGQLFDGLKGLFSISLHFPLQNWITFYRLEKF
jgi:hypothetical protein